MGYLRKQIQLFFSGLGILILIGTLACAQSERTTEEESEDNETIEDSTEDNVSSTSENLAVAVDTLEEIGCLTADSKETISGKIDAADDGFTNSVEEANGNGLCETGATLLQAIAASEATPYFEPEQIIFDADANGCVESFFNTEDYAISVIDANEDSCLDMAWDFADVVDDFAAESEAALVKSVTSDIAETLRFQMEDMLQYLFPPEEDVQESLGDYDFDTYHQNASIRLDQLITTVESIINDQATLEVLTNYLENIRPFVEDFESCPTTDSEFEEAPTEFLLADPSITVDQDGTAITRLFCIYVNQGHGWMSLETSSGERHVRGFYKGTRGDKQSAGPVPKAQLMKNDSSDSDSSDGSSDKPSQWISGIENPNGTGYITEGDKTKPGYRLCWTITVEEWNTVVETINKDISSAPEYRYFSNNCLGWAVKFANLLKKLLPAHTYWGTPAPETFTETLKKAHDAGKVPEGATSLDKFTAQ